LRNSIAATDSEQVRRLRAAGCVILGKTNMSEFASGAAVSTLGGQILNPHALDRTPRGSSGGSGVGVAAGFAMFALGTDTGGSIRRPSAATGIVGLKPTYGLNGRSGIVPLALSLDTVGPMARNVADIAVVLNAMAGFDPGDPATKDAAAKRAPDYTAELKLNALQGVRFGLLRDWMGTDHGVDVVVEAAIAVLRNQGAEIVDVSIPRYVLGLGGGLYNAIHDPEFHRQIDDYLATLPGAGLPRNLQDIVQLTAKITAPTPEGWVPNPDRLISLRRQAKAGSLQDVPYLNALNEGRKIVRENLTWIMTEKKLDAFIVPTSSSLPELIAPVARGEGASHTPPPLAGSVDQFSNITGWPDLVVPAGFAGEPALPVGLSFIGPAFSEARLLGYGYAFEAALPARRLPRSTPALPGEAFTYETRSRN
jgi:amidase